MAGSATYYFYEAIPQGRYSDLRWSSTDYRQQAVSYAILAIVIELPNGIVLGFPAVELIVGIAERYRPALQALMSGQANTNSSYRSINPF